MSCLAGEGHCLLHVFSHKLSLTENHLECCPSQFPDWYPGYTDDCPPGAPACDWLLSSRRLEGTVFSVGSTKNFWGRPGQIWPPVATFWPPAPPLLPPPPPLPHTAQEILVPGRVMTRLGKCNTYGWVWVAQPTSNWEKHLKVEIQDGC